MQKHWKVKELAARWQCSEMHIYRLVAQGSLKGVKIGKLIRFRLEDIEAYEEAQTTQEAA